MSPPRRGEDGVPMLTGRLAQSAPEESWPGANQDKDEKLRVRGVQRLAGDGGYTLRHSDYGYALIGADRKPVDGRTDMSLKEIESLLAKERKR